MMVALRRCGTRPGRRVGRSRSPPNIAAGYMTRQISSGWISCVAPSVNAAAVKAPRMPPTRSSRRRASVRTPAMVSSGPDMLRCRTLATPYRSTSRCQDQERCRGTIRRTRRLRARRWQGRALRRAATSTLHPFSTAPTFDFWLPLYFAVPDAISGTKCTKSVPPNRGGSVCAPGRRARGVGRSAKGDSDGDAEPGDGDQCCGRVGGRPFAGCHPASEPGRTELHEGPNGPATDRVVVG